MRILVIVGCLTAGLSSFSFWVEQPNFKASYQRGKLVYSKTCVTCHQPEGDGVPRMNPPLIQTSQVLGDKEKLIRIVLQGFNEEVEINGDYFTNPMPAQPQLSNLEIADVLTYVRNSFGNKASAITEAEVKAVRMKIKQTTKR